MTRVFLAFDSNTVDGIYNVFCGPAFVQYFCDIPLMYMTPYEEVVYKIGKFAKIIYDF